MNVLEIFLIRIALGERWRRATPEDYRLWFACLLWFSATILYVFGDGHRAIMQASDTALWVGAIAWGVSGYLFVGYSKKSTPAIVPFLAVVVMWTIHWVA